MSIEKLNDERLEAIAGGMTAELKAAYACIRGDYGNGSARVTALRKAGFDPEVVQNLVNSILAGNEKVALDVIDGKYGNGEARVIALRKAGYEPEVIQKLVNAMLLK
jgi:hypothetical protein